jgi:hypothetical protein
MSGAPRAMEPEQVTRLVVERLNAGDAAGVAAPSEPQACWPTQPIGRRPGVRRSGRYQQMVDAGVSFGIETPLPTVRFEDCR